jgi:hypothetical protein
MSRAGRAVGPTARGLRAGRLLEVALGPDLPARTRCAGNLTLPSALSWLLLAIADFSRREDDTGIPESGTSPRCHRDAWTPLEALYRQRQQVRPNEPDVDWQGATLHSLYLAPW